MQSQTNQLMKSFLNRALNLDGFENWRPDFDVPHLDRPQERPSDLPGDGSLAAVMLLLFPGMTEQESEIPTVDQTNLVLTKRNSNLSKHAGQISFPGGRRDEGESLEQTALRETEEEIGIATVLVTVLGKLNPVYIPPTDFTVTPFVGWVDHQPSFVRSEAEVEEIIPVSLSHLMNPATMVSGVVTTAKYRLKVPYYQVDHHQIWGATALMLGELLERLKRTEFH